MAVVLKVSYQDQVFRVQLQESNITYQGVQDALQKLVLDAKIIAKYVDEENDVCTLCQGSFADFVSLSRDVNGKKILKLTLSTQAVTSADVTTYESEPTIDNSDHLASAHATQEDEVCQSEDVSSPPVLPIALLKAGIGMFKSLTQQALKGHCKRRHHSCEFRPKKVKFLIWLLHKNGLLNDTSMAAIAIHSLPQLILFTLERSDKIDRKFCEKRLYFGPVLEGISGLAARTPGLEQCASKITHLVSNQGQSASETLMELLTAIDTLTLDVQVDFFKAIYKSLGPRLQAKLAKADGCNHWLPYWPLEHAGVTCDGCGQHLSRGLRFKCSSCLECDLCSECFTRKTIVREGVCSHHQFEMVGIDGNGKGKGKGKCFPKGFLKGKGKSKGKFWNKGGFGEFWQNACSNQFSGGCESCSCTAFDCEHEGLLCSSILPAEATSEKHPCSMPGAEVPEEKQSQHNVLNSHSKGSAGDVDEASRKKCDDSDDSAAVDSNRSVRVEAKHEETEGAADSVETELMAACSQMQEMGFGNEEFLMEMLKSHGGNMQDVIGELIFRD